ncbi:MULTISPECIES: FMN-binding protein [unclassified Frankia]|uniref:FMN-binding protein n=1 Tax=unclassified Frankia TaxID=2632575 RepID=UPI002AD49EDD|nr:MULTISPECIES: FMN-binding protein [unclassified Frankia]
MRRIVVAIASTVAGLVLLFSYRTSTSTGATVASAAAVSTGDSATTSDSGSVSTAVSTAGATAGSTSGSTSGGSTATTGSAVNTRWGVVQVRITVAAGRIVSAETVQLPDHNPRDIEINRVAVPVLNSETVASQSAKIDVVSGATVTSDGYIRSLQSAIDAAHLS